MRLPSFFSAAALFLSLPAGAIPVVDFDAGADASIFLDEARRAAAAEQAAEPHLAPLSRSTPDCATFTFPPQAPAVSEAIWLSSVEWVEECFPTGDPRYGGGRQCHRRPGFTHRELVQLTIVDRKPLLPWEQDVFRVCLDGPFLNTHQLESAYEYRRVVGAGRGGSIVLSPVKKTPMRPDPAGVTATLGPDLTATFADRWASYYGGETVILQLTLKKRVENWFDLVLLEKEVELPTAASYVLDLAAEAANMSAKPQKGKEYYLSYSVKRVGAVSRPVFTKPLESNRAVYVPGSAVVSN